MMKISKKQTSTIIVITYFVAAFVYAYIRYAVYGNAVFATDANFIINKAFAATAVLSVFSAYMISSLAKTGNNFARKNSSYKRYFGLSGFYFICLHVFFGFRIIKPEHHPQFFGTNDELALRGEIIIIIGVISLILFMFPAISSMKDVMKKLGKSRWSVFQRIGYIAFLMVMIHATMVGYHSWISPSTWYGGMPPITLICVTLIFLAISFRLYILLKFRK